MKEISILSSLGIGDVITLHPLLKKLKNLYPESKIKIYSSRGGFLENCKIKEVDETIRLRSIKGLARFILEKPDLMINLGYYSNICGKKGVFLYNLLNFISRAKLKAIHYELDSEDLNGLNMAELKLDVLKKIGINSEKGDYQLESFIDFNKSEPRIKEILSEKGIKKGDFVVVCHAGAKGGCKSRLWAADKWAIALQFLKERYNAKILLIGNTDDFEISKEIVSNVKGVASLVGKLSFEETGALINKCSLFLSTNSGPMWVAAMLHKPQIALCGPSKFAWEPYNEKAKVVRGLLFGKDCPCDNNRCELCNLSMKSIKAADVKDAVREVLKNGSN